MSPSSKISRLRRAAPILTRHDVRYPWVLIGVLAVPVLGCAGGSLSPAIARIAHERPTATFEAGLRGCGSRQSTTRRFGRELRTAVLWGRQAVDSARALPCEAVVEAVEDGARSPVYHILRNARGVMEATIAGRP